MSVDPYDLADEIVESIEDETGNDMVAAAETVWLALAKAIAPYFDGGGGGAVNQVTAGSSKVSVSPTTGNVVVDVVPANFTGIPQTLRNIDSNTKKRKRVKPKLKAVA
jgi:hypothetical protein